jgi:hypothetical protein
MIYQTILLATNTKINTLAGQLLGLCVPILAGTWMSDF